MCCLLDAINSIHVHVNNDIGKFTSNLCCHSVTSVNKSERPSASTSAGCSTSITEERGKKVNFNDDELRVILELSKTNASILNGKFTPNITQKGKNRIRDSTAVATSACAYAVRSAHEVKLLQK